MAKTTTNPLTQSISTFGTIILPAQAVQAVDAVGVVTNTVLLYTAGAEGAIIKSLLIASNDTAAKYVSIWIQPGGTGGIYLLGQVAVPITSGFSATGVVANVDVLNNQYLLGLPMDQSGRQVLPVSAGTKLYAGVAAAPNATKTLHITGIAEEF